MGLALVFSGCGAKQLPPAPYEPQIIVVAAASPECRVLEPVHCSKSGGGNIALNRAACSRELKIAGETMGGTHIVLSAGNAVDTDRSRGAAQAELISGQPAATCLDCVEMNGQVLDCAVVEPDASTAEPAQHAVEEAASGEEPAPPCTSGDCP